MPPQENTPVDQNESATTVDVVIIGAGASGVQCAHELMESSTSMSVMVLEARDRIGGRVYSVPFPEKNLVYDEGGAWVSGLGFEPMPQTKEEREQIYAQAAFGTEEEYDMIHANPMMTRLLEFWKSEGVDDWLDGTHLHGYDGNPWMRPQTALKDTGNLAMFVNGKRLNDTDIQDAIDLHHQIFIKIRNELRTIEDLMMVPVDLTSVPLQAAVEKAKVWIALSNGGVDPIDPDVWANTNKMQDVVMVDDDRFVNADFFQYMMEGWYASPSTRIQVEDYTQWHPNGTVLGTSGDFVGAHCQVAEGMVSVLQPLLVDTVRNQIHLEEAVVSVREVNDKRLCVETSKGNTVYCKVCVSTIPLGVLKRDHQKMFDPPLSAAKQYSIERLHMGNYKKVLMEFEEITWPVQPKLIGVSTLADVTLPANHLVVHNLWAASRGMPFLEVFLIEDAAAWAAGKDKDVICNATIEFLESAMGMSLGKCVWCHVSRWEESEWSCGAYSSWQVGCDKVMEGWEEKEMGGKLIFSGEATHMEHPATVHGALMSGMIAAEKVTKFLSTNAEEQKKA